VPRPFHRSLDFRGLQCWLDDPSDTDRHLVLQIENVLKRAVEMVGPEMCAALRFDQLSGNPHPVSAFPDRAFQHVPHAKFAAHLLQVNRAALVSAAGVSGDYEQPADAGERGDDLLDHAVGEIFLLGITAHIGEGQHRDRRLVG
jgi:hypothetical protein